MADFLVSGVGGDGLEVISDVSRRTIELIREGELPNWTNPTALNRYFVMKLKYQALSFIRYERNRLRRLESLERMDDDLIAHSDEEPISPLLQRLSAKLPRNNYIVLVMHYLFGFSRAEIARRLGVPDSTVGRRLDTAIRIARAELGPEDAWR
jgi:RNA polymerase sigma factor (sigma-70 family)